MYTDQSFRAVLQALQTGEHGLSLQQVESVREKTGWNELPRKRRSLVLLFLRQFHSVLIYILFGALILSLAIPLLEGHAWTLESVLDAIVILAILLLNALLGFVQEYKADQAIVMLEHLTAPTARVRREGKLQIIPSRELVPGDIVLIEAGDKLSADGRLISESHLQCNESSLTGESSVVDKTADPLQGENLPLGDRRNMVFAGTLVTRGVGEMVVTATALGTEIGKIANLVSQTRMPETPLAHRMNQLSMLLGIVVLSLSSVVVLVSWLQGRPFWTILLTGASLAVSAVPEGLPAVVTVSLALGVRRMIRHHTLVRRLDALETLGSVTVICADKTGTITENKMRVVETWVDATEDTPLLAEIAASCNHAHLPDIGDPTEIGLLAFAEEQKVARLPIDREEVPFSSEDKYMQTVHGRRSYLKGAPEVIVRLCQTDAPLMHQRNAAFAQKGLRVLACAVLEQGEKIPRLVGLIALTDPPRATVKAAIAEAGRAGIRTIMITGDNLETALAIAAQVGIKGKGMLGEELDNLTSAKLRARLRTVSVFARVSPKHKLQILKALEEGGAIVAMSGDGVNDAPALKGANVGIAMGKVGTDVAREAASIVLTDDDYATIVAAVREGRRIYDNIRKFVLFLVRANFDEILFLLLTTFMGLPLPYLPLHILWINLMTDSLPALALGMEPAEKDIMLRPPRDPKEHIFAGQSGILILATLIGTAVVLLPFLFFLNHQTDLVRTRTVILSVAIVFEMFLAYSSRSNRPFWTLRFFGNPWLLGALLIPMMLHALLLYTPLSGVFDLVALSWRDVVLVFVISFTGFLAFEATKVVLGKGQRTKD